MPEQKLQLSENDLPAFFKELNLIGSLNCSFLVSKKNNGFFIKGTASGLQNFVCARSLEPFNLPFEIEVEVMVEVEAGLTHQKEDDGSGDFYTIKVSVGQNEVDLTETLRQMIILQEPMVPVKE